MKVTIDGIEYELNVEKAVNSGLLTRTSPKVGRGMKWRQKDGSTIYILAAPDSNTMALICTQDGNRWRDSRPVGDVVDLTPQEVKNVFGDFEKWEQVT